MTITTTRLIAREIARIAALALSVTALATPTWAEEPAPEGEPAVRLESTFTGDKEQPAVSYFMPWQGTSTPDKLQWNIADSHDGTLNAIDRDIMVRSMNMYNEMNLENH